MPYNLWKMQLPPLNFVLVSKILHSFTVLQQKVLDVFPQDLKYLNLIMSQDERDRLNWKRKEMLNHVLTQFEDTDFES